MSVSIVVVLIALLLAGTMGFAIQRGATCTVAAMDELVHQRRAHRLSSMLEASLWVVGGFLIALALGRFHTLPAGYAVGVPTVLGGVLLGVGAYVNQACVFGAIARLGSGEWAYALTPIGFFAGCLSLPLLPLMPARSPLAEVSPLLALPRILALAAVLFMLWRLLPPLWRLGRTHGVHVMRNRPRQIGADIAARVWRPHAATAVIGVTFFFLLMMMGAWAYTDVLAELARGMTQNIAVRGLLLLALLAGAILGGWSAGRLRATAPGARALLQCLSGGWLMGLGSLLIPGSNDGIILLGMPLLWPYAWVAFAAMCGSIGAIMLVQKRINARPTS